MRAIVNAPTGLGFVFSSDKPLAKLLRPFVTLALRLTLSPKGAKVIFENPDDLAALTAAGMVRPAAAVLIRGAGVNTDEFSPAPEPPGPVRVILIARMIRAKGIAVFCEAARILHGQAEFILAGAPDPGNLDSSREAVVDGQTGFLVPPGDASALAAGLKKLIASPELRARMGAAARARAVQEFSSPHICAQTLLVYAALVPGDPP